MRLRCHLRHRRDRQRRLRWYTAYDGLHGHPYGIFLYPNPFSIGLLNLIALALPWRWQATYRTTP